MRVGGEDSPEGIANNEEGHVVFVCIVEDCVALRFDHIAIGKY